MAAYWKLAGLVGPALLKITGVVSGPTVAFTFFDKLVNGGEVIADFGGTVRFGSPGTSTAFYNSGTVLVNGGNLEFSGSVSFGGQGNITLSSAGSNTILSDGNTATFDNVDNVISGTGTIGDNNLTLVNSAGGVIEANNPGGILFLSSTNTWFNVGLMQAINGGLLYFGGTSTISNSGLIGANGS